jgi:hypothetical protein
VRRAKAGLRAGGVLEERIKMNKISMHVFVMAAFLVTSLNSCMEEKHAANM